MSKQDGIQVSTVQPPTTNDMNAWRDYWQKQGTLLSFVRWMGAIGPHRLHQHLVDATTIHVQDFKAIVAPLKMIADRRNTPKLHQHKACQGIVVTAFLVR